MGLWGSIRKRFRFQSGEQRVVDAVRRQGEMAYSFIVRKDYATAKEILLRALTERNRIHDRLVLDWLLELLAWIWTATEQYEDSTDFFSKFLTQYPSDVRGHTLLAGSLWYAGNLREAIEAYSKALALDSRDILAYLGRGQVFVEIGEYGKAADDLDFALDHLEQAERLVPSWNTQIRAYCLNGRAMAHAGLGDFDRAFAEFDRSVSLCPENAWVYFNRATIYESRGQLAEAVADYKLSLQKSLPKLTPLKRKYAEVKLKAITT